MNVRAVLLRPRLLGVMLMRYGPFVAVLLALLSLLTIDSEGLAGLVPRWPLVSLSFLLLCAVFLGRACIWGLVLRAFGYPIPLRLALTSSNRSLLFKYVPGKIWVVLGRAGYVHQTVGYPLLHVGGLSMLLQLLTIAIGLLLGAVGVLFLCCPDAATVALMVSPLMLWFFARPLRLPPTLVRWVPKAHLRAMLLRGPLPPLAGILLAVAAQWLALGLSYWIFFRSCSVEVPWQAVLLQPGANAAGIAALFAPGGIGIREGVAAAYLVKLGVSLPLALAIGIAARFWFLAVELVLFALSYVAPSPDMNAAGRGSVR